MPNLPDHSTREELLTFLADSNLEYATIGFADYQGTVRGQYVGRARLEAALGTVSLPLFALALDPTDIALGSSSIADLNPGAGDKPAKLLPETARLIPWERPGRNLFLLAEFAGEWAQYCPRQVYQRVFGDCKRTAIFPAIPLSLNSPCLTRPRSRWWKRDIAISRWRLPTAPTYRWCGKERKRSSITS